MALILPTAAAAEDRVFVLGPDRGELTAYLGSTGAVDIGPVQVGSVFELERSSGGTRLYGLNAFGETEIVDTRTGARRRAVGSVGGSAEDLAVDPARGQLYVVNRTPNLHVQAANGTGYTASIPVRPVLDAVASSQGLGAAFVFEWSSGDLLEVDPVSGAVLGGARLGHDVWELRVSPDDRYVVAVGPDERGGSSLGDSSDPLHITVYDRWLDRARHTWIPHGQHPGGIAFDAAGSGRVWIGSEVGVHGVDLSSRNPQPTALPGAPPWVRDLSSTPAGDLYVLTDGALLHRPPAGALREVRAFTDGRWRTQLEVVPRLPRFDRGPSVQMNPALAGFIEALRVAGATWAGPGFTCATCADDEVEAAADGAAAWLDGEGLLEGEVGLVEAATFLSKWTGEGAEPVGAFLDDALLGAAD
jgi:DNA-binding beta-propeller fold protein YncE